MLSAEEELPTGDSLAAELTRFLREREDYVGKEQEQLDPERGRPVMSIVTERGDGSNDVMVFAPAATARGR